MNETKIDTIKALLAKAESTTNAHEAEVFTAKAMDLMVKYGIERAMVDSRAAAGKKEEIVTVKFRIQDPYADVLIPAVYGFARKYNDAIDGYYIGRASNDRTMYFVGYTGDLELLTILLSSLLIQAKGGLESWITEQGLAYSLKGRQEKWHDRRSYLGYFFVGAGDKVRASRKTAEAAAEPGTDIVLADRAANVKANMAERNLSKSRGSRTYGSAGAQAGRRDGQKADLGTGNLSGGRTSLER